MSMNYSVRHGVHPTDFKTYTTQQTREHFLVENLFVKDEINLVYSMYDRLIVGGAMPTSKNLELETFDDLKMPNFLDRREIGIINVGDTGVVSVEGKEYTLEAKEALYIGMGTKDVVFKAESGKQPLFYFNSAPAHRNFPTKKVAHTDGQTVEMGALENSNHRVIRKALVTGVIETCQLQMGITTLQTGSVWNTMPAHTHNRRMEAYFYFELGENDRVCHFMGEPDETRHIWMKNNEAVISPTWSIHSGAGTKNYTFIWGMAGENLDYGDMDIVQPKDMR